MNRVSAEKVAAAGFQYIGRRYQEMDCQAFVERCLKDAGISEDLKGSNEWFRKVRTMGWVGTPEECRKQFGSVPKGAFLFIWKNDGGEEKRGYYDGLGNASHIGLVTGTGKGAIHSSESRGGVCESAFAGKTIPNGGWNRVGLWPRLSYGEKIDALLAGDGQESEGGGQVETAVVWAANGGTVKLRGSRDKGTAGYGLYDDIPVGTQVEVLQRGEEWSMVSCGRRKGWWMKTEFLRFDGAQAEPGEEPAAPAGEDGALVVSLSLSRKEAELLLKIADNLGWQLMQITGGLG